MSMHLGASEGHSEQCQTLAARVLTGLYSSGDSTAVRTATTNGYTAPQKPQRGTKVYNMSRAAGVDSPVRTARGMFG